MAKQTVITKKRRGPAPTGKGKLIGVRLQPDQLQTLDEWVVKNDPTATRPEAVRQLIELGMTVRASKAGGSRTAAARAAELAGKVIDQHIAADAPTEERTSRKRRLLRGPSAFRDVRKDRPK